MAIRKRNRKFAPRSFPVSYLLPNIITLAALCIGLSGIRWAMHGRYELAVTFILLAAFLDGMDGRVARMLNATSTFGAHLDSLADFVSFGIAPVMIVYLWTLQDIPRYGWMAVLVCAVCTALRLARFNTTHIFDTPPPSKEEPDKYFTGVPAPAGALLCIAPMVLSFQFGEGWYSSPHFNLIYVPIISLMMASRIPTFSIKKVKIKSSMAAPFMALSGLFIAGCIIEPWFTFTIIAGVYLALIPFSVIQHRRDSRAAVTEE